MHNPLPGGDLIEERPWIVNVLDKVQFDHSYMVLITCEKCGELDYLTSKAFSNLTDFGYKCRSCGTINTITLENGELKK